MKHTIAALLCLTLAACSNGPTMTERRPDGTIRFVTTYTGIFDKSATDDHRVQLADGTVLEFKATNRDNTKAASVWGNLQTTKQAAPLMNKLGNLVNP